MVLALASVGLAHFMMLSIPLQFINHTSVWGGSGPLGDPISYGFLNDKIPDVARINASSLEALPRSLDPDSTGSTKQAWWALPTLDLRPHSIANDALAIDQLSQACKRGDLGFFTQLIPDDLYDNDDYVLNNYNDSVSQVPASLAQTELLHTLFKLSCSDYQLPGGAKDGSSITGYYDAVKHSSHKKLAGPLSALMCTAHRLTRG